MLIAVHKSFLYEKDRRHGQNRDKNRMIMGRQTERRRQARRRARRRAFFLAAAELAADDMHDHGSDGHGHTGETGIGNGRNRAGTDKAGNNRAGKDRAAMYRIWGRDRNPVPYIGEDTCVLQSSIKGQGNPSFLLAVRILYIQVPLLLRWMQAMAVEDEGASQEGVMEKDINLAIAERLKVKLEDMGYTVVMVREDDAYRSKEERVEAAHKVRAGAYVSIHQNTWEDAAARGIETWYSGKDGASDSGRLAALVHKEAVRSTGAEARELRGDAEFTVTGQTFVPSCLIETGFLV
ncbi:MAG: N-acetylmuramoyl-L-alanine amidase family protein [Acutalibacteraceae bacterium]